MSFKVSKEGLLISASVSGLCKWDPLGARLGGSWDWLASSWKG